MGRCAALTAASREGRCGCRGAGGCRGARGFRRRPRFPARSRCAVRVRFATRSACARGRTSVFPRLHGVGPTFDVRGLQRCCERRVVCAPRRARPRTAARAATTPDSLPSMPWLRSAASRSRDPQRLRAAERDVGVDCKPVRARTLLRGHRVSAVVANGRRLYAQDGAVVTLDVMAYAELDAQPAAARTVVALGAGQAAWSTTSWRRVRSSRGLFQPSTPTTVPWWP
jgi:hypothetical protein